jgi:hypothetical protein
LLDGIQCDNQIVITAKTNVRMNQAMRTSFQVAVDHLSELIGSTFSNASYQGKRPARNVSGMEAGRGGCGGCGGGRLGRGGRGRGLGGRGTNTQNGKFHNGVDISDMTRNFTYDEWRKLGPDAQIRTAREEANMSPTRKRSVAAVIAEPVEENPVTPVDNEDKEDPGSNGSGFGSEAYSNKRRGVARCQQSCRHRVG